MSFSSAGEIASVIEPNVTSKKDTLKALDNKVSDRKDKLHNALTNCQNSEKTLDELLYWLRANDKAMKSLKPMSENMDDLLQLRDFYEVCGILKSKRYFCSSHNGLCYRKIPDHHVLNNFFVLFKNLRCELSNHEPLYDDGIKWSRDVVSKEKPGPYRSGLEKKYTEVVTLWRELKMKVRSNLREINVIIPLAKKYHSAVKPVRDVTDQVMC